MVYRAGNQKNKTTHARIDVLLRSFFLGYYTNLTDADLIEIIHCLRTLQKALGPMPLDIFLMVKTLVDRELDNARRLLEARRSPDA